MTMLSQNFSLQEFYHSDTALRLGIDNGLPVHLLDAARATAMMLERIRHHLSLLKKQEVPIHITSGYRCLTLNQRIGSASTSDHVKALAADIKAPAFGSPLEVCRALEPVRAQMGIGQLIHEHKAWVHVSSGTPAQAVNAVLTIDETGIRPGLV